MTSASTPAIPAERSAHHAGSASFAGTGAGALEKRRYRSSCLNPLNHNRVYNIFVIWLSPLAIPIAAHAILERWLPMGAGTLDLAKLLPLLIPVLLIQFGLQIYALIDLSRRSREQVRGGNKWLWVAIIVLGEILGPIVYFVVARKDE